MAPFWQCCFTRSKDEEGDAHMKVKQVGFDMERDAYRKEIADLKVRHRIQVEEFQRLITQLQPHEDNTCQEDAEIQNSSTKVDNQGMEEKCTSIQDHVVQEQLEDMMRRLVSAEEERDACRQQMAEVEATAEGESSVTRLQIAELQQQLAERNEQHDAALEEHKDLMDETIELHQLASSEHEQHLAEKTEQHHSEISEHKQQITEQAERHHVDLHEHKRSLQRAKTSHAEEMNRYETLQRSKTEPIALLAAQLTDIQARLDDAGQDWTPWNKIRWLKDDLGTLQKKADEINNGWGTPVRLPPDVAESSPQIPIEANGNSEGSVESQTPNISFAQMRYSFTDSTKPKHWP